ncbi:hypothetical protein XaavBphi31_05 [Xanthomonas phage Xaa_vB_phi31]|uniref:Uncharacterized protein n=1 Tax=Xanthomonas phage Xaa_vB_phi31 TaxID=2776752 RepID=A0A868BYY8_9CAUD|nr:hypothetical protein XaavBphi31_05 [Xanthomonas phage Xaa_vB_phi31]
MISIHWEVGGSAGTSTVPRRRLCNEIAKLRKAGYTVVGVQPA